MAAADTPPAAAAGAEQEQQAPASDASQGTCDLELVLATRAGHLLDQRDVCALLCTNNATAASVARSISGTLAVKASPRTLQQAQSLARWLGVHSSLPRSLDVELYLSGGRTADETESRANEEAAATVLCAVLPSLTGYAELTVYGRRWKVQLSGYAELTVSGEPVTDEVLQRVAATNAGRLTSLKVVGARNVTDAGLCAAIRASPQLRQFVLEDAGQGVTGAFVPALLQHCRQLESLAVEGAERISWSLLRQPGTWAAEAAAAGLPPQPQQQAASTSASATASCSTLSRAVRAAQSARTAAHTAAGASGTSSAAHALLQLQQDQQHQDQQQQHDQGETDGDQYRHSRRLSSSSSISSSGGMASGLEPAESDSGGSSSSSLGAASDATSISVPAAAVSELTLQLRDASLSGEAGVPSSSSSPWHPAAAAGQQAVEAQARARHHLAAAGSPPSSSAAAAVLGRRPHSALRRLRVRFTSSEGLAQLLAFAPAATELSLDGPAAVVRAAVALCPSLRRLTYLVSSPAELDAALLCLAGARSLEALELEVKAMVLSPAQLGAIGMLPLRELCLDSHAFRQHPSMPRPQYSHLDNDGVKALVDAVCTRMRTELMPLKLSLCGATALRQEAVSALLRLPILASIDTGGCVKLTPMDRMRLVAKVKAGQGMLDARGGFGSAGSSGLAALRQLAHVL